jgi:ribosome-associated translation inhibitor RaiA
MELHVEARNMEMRKSWQDKIDQEKERLIRHHPGLVHNLRITIDETSHHQGGGYEMRLVASVPNDTVVVKRKGETVRPMLVEAFDTLGLQLKELQRKRRQPSKAVEEGEAPATPPASSRPFSLLSPMVSSPPTVAARSISTKTP